MPERLRFVTDLTAVAQKNDKNQSEPEAGLFPEGPPQGNEFENAVTTEISAALGSAFGEGQATEPNDVYVTDMQLTAHVDPAADDALSPGFILNDRFEIVELVYSGGMSLIYKAVDQRRRPEGSGETHVAIKMMRQSIAPDEKASLSLEREAAKAQSLSHPNIINIFDFDDNEGRFFLVMEWLEGESVNAMLRRTSGEPLESVLAWRVIEGAAAGVEHAHQKNVVHADINPSNIFVTENGDIKLLDFGVARYASNADCLEDDRFAWVTKSYASPEVLSGSTPVFEDDVFSLACVAYRLLGGKHPFGGMLSLVAKHQGITVEPIPGLPENEWRILQRALAYERSERPGSAREFVTHGAKASGQELTTGRRTGRAALLMPTSLIAVAALVIAAGGLWLLQRGGDGETDAPVEPALTETPVAIEPVGAPAVSVTDALLEAANQALGEGQLVAPDDRNARALFREVLVLEPDNAEALRGLRTIGNDFVQQAQLALKADEPLQAYAALAVATETDPANRAIEIVNQLLAAKADRELADIRLAVATGNLDLAAQRLTRAEQYRNIDPAEVQLIRWQIEQSRQGDRLLASLAAADAHITAGRLLSPEGDNAHALLLDLYGQHGDDARLLASMERLGERLMTRAAFAAAAARVADATELLDAVDALGVLTPEVGAARMSLERIDAVSEAEDVQAPRVAEEPSDVAPRAEDVQALQVAEEQSGAVTETEDAQVPQVAEEQSADALLAASAGEQAIPEEPGAQAATTNAVPEIRRLSLQELGIREYVVPKFPGHARRGGISGMVEVGFTINADGSTGSVRVVHSQPGRIFAKSATEAVRQWRFEPRDEALKAQVALRFELSP